MPHSFTVALSGRAIAAVTAILASAIGLAAVLLVDIADTEDRRTALQARAFVDILLQTRSDALRRTLRDYSDWGEAYRNLHLGLDTDWAFERNNLGRSLFEDFGVNYVSVVDPDDREVYALVDGELSGAPVLATLQGGAAALVAAARSSDEPASGMLVSPEGEAVLISARALTTGEDRLVRADGRRTVLVFGDRLGRSDLRALSAGIFDDELVLTLRDGDPRAEPGGQIVLDSVDGTIRRALHISAPEPGRAMLDAIAPWALAMAVLLLLAILLIARQGRRIASMSQEAARASAQAHRLAQHQATHDAVTALPNRLAFEAHMAGEIARERGDLAVFYLDLDHFKPVNDTHGHAAGDFVLRTVAHRIRAVLPGSGFAARIGGDEFVALLRHRDDLVVQRFGRDLIAAISAPIAYEGTELRVGVSVGIARILAQDGPDDAVRRADAALFKAKAAGRARSHWSGRPDPAHDVA